MRWHETPSRLAGILPIGAVVLASSLLSGQALAQSVTSDASGLTTVTPGGGGTFSITGGSPSGTNLFHSFDEFSIPHSGSATFNNALTVSNIISRVTGTAASDIQGTISAQGTANLFLINPNGIVFGPNAQLAIGGSFIGSTAESIQFQNGVSYLASDTTPNPMLSVSVPIGLQLGASSQTIRVEDTGATALFPQPAVVDSSSSLLVNSGQTFALIGNGITFQGGKVAIPGGRIALGSVQEGLVTLNAAGWIPSYENITNFADIDLIERSLLNASSVLFDTSTIALDPITGQPQPLNPVTGIVDFGTPLPVFPAGQGGNIQLDGRRLSMSGSSLALIQNFGPLASGSVDVHARERVELADADVSRVISSGLITNHLSSGGGGGINVTTPQLLLINDGLIATDTFSPANNAAQAGKITLRTDNIEITDVAQVAAGRRTLGGITASSSGTGQGGVIDIETDTLNISGDGIASGANRLGTGGNVIVVADALRITNSGSISAAAFNLGQGGDVHIDVDDIFVSGIGTQTFFPSGIYASTVGPGNAGSLLIDTQRLVVQEGARIDSSTVASGNAGTVTVNAAESIVVTGAVPGSFNANETSASTIISSADVVDPTFKAFLESRGAAPIPASPSGASGDVTINTPSLFIGDGAQVTVLNDGSGDAGTLTANTNNRIHLDNGRLTASTQQGGGGNLFLNSRDLLLLRRGSLISAEANGLGNGGNISINSLNLVAIENSDIIANAVQGAGGRVTVNTQSIFGTQFREQRTPESDITASSQFGASGIVAIENPETTPDSSLVALPSDVSDSSDQIVAGCSNAQSSQFVATGRGGLPLAPSQAISANSVWADVRPLTLAEDTSTENSIPTPVPEATITEATGFSLGTNGEPILVASSSGATDLAAVPTCLTN